MAKRIEIDEAKLRELHAAKMSDREIAKELGCSDVTICHHRKVLGLPPVGRKGRRPRGDGAAASPAPKPIRAHSIVKAEHPQMAQITQTAEAPANGAGRARCRVAMFEIEGTEAAVMRAIDAVQSALAARAN